jgi:hypothetical protein
MGLKYRRFGAVALTAGLILSMAGTGAVLAVDPPADDIVFDGVLTVHWIDRVDGVMDGAVVRVFFYRDGDPIHGIVPGFVITGTHGEATITGVPHAIEGAAPVFLDIDARIATSTIDENGCSVFQNWQASRLRVKSTQHLQRLLQTTFRGEPVVNCPEAG